MIEPQHPRNILILIPESAFKAGEIAIYLGKLGLSDFLIRYSSALASAMGKVTYGPLRRSDLKRFGGAMSYAPNSVREALKSTMSSLEFTQGQSTPPRKSGKGTRPPRRGKPAQG